MTATVILYESDEALSPFHAIYTPEAFAYLVAWRAAGIVKTGETASPRRWRRWVSTGADILLLARAPAMVALDIEATMYRHLRETAPLAFYSREDAYPYLNRAGGHMECFRADPDATLTKMREVVSALVQD